MPDFVFQRLELAVQSHERPLLPRLKDARQGLQQAGQRRRERNQDEQPALDEAGQPERKIALQEGTAGPMSMPTGYGWPRAIFRISMDSSWRLASYGTGLPGRPAKAALCEPVTRPGTAALIRDTMTSTTKAKRLSRSRPGAIAFLQMTQRGTTDLSRSRGDDRQARPDNDPSGPRKCGWELKRTVVNHARVQTAPRYCRRKPAPPTLAPPAPLARRSTPPPDCA